VIVVQMIFKLEITKQSYIGNVLMLILIKDNKLIDIEYNMVKKQLTNTEVDKASSFKLMIGWIFII
jgi:hypothetical protein